MTSQFTKTFSLLTHCFWSHFICFDMHAFITVLILLSFISTHHLVCILTYWNCLHHLHIPPPFISFALPTHHLPTHLVTYHLNPILLISPQIGIPMFSQFPSYLSTNFLLSIKMFFIMFLYPLMYVSHHYGLSKPLGLREKQCSFLSSTKSISVSFLLCSLSFLNVTFIYSSLLNHVFNTIHFPRKT